MPNRITGAATAAILCLLCAGLARAETPLERGAYLVNTIAACGNCHTQQGPDGPAPGVELAGGMQFDMNPAFVAYAPNITPDAETGIGNWSDAEIAKAIREGLRPDGSLIGPPMPLELYRGISDADLAAIVAYVRSVPPVRNAVPKSSFNIPLPPAYGPPVEGVAEVARDDPATYGAYLAGPMGHCIECHTPMVGHARDFENRLNAGGFEIPGPWGIAVTPNITPDEETGIGTWSDADIKRAITEGVRPDGGLLGPPMAFHYYRNIRAEDLDAIVAYLRSVKPVKSE